MGRMGCASCLGWRSSFLGSQTLMRPPASWLVRWHWGPKYSHFVDVWVAYRYWQNKFGLDHNAMPGVCTIAATGASTHSCTESSLYSGVTVKF